MIQNVDMTEAALKVADDIKNSSAIKDFISEQFQAEELKVFVGDMLRVQIPRAEDTPYIVLFDWKKREGIDTEFCKYTCTIAIGVGCGARPEFVESDNGVLLLDAYDVSNKFAQLIIDVINKRKNGDRPLSSVEMEGPYVIDADGGHWGTLLECTWRIYQTMGLEQEDFQKKGVNENGTSYWRLQ